MSPRMQLIRHLARHPESCFSALESACALAPIRRDSIEFRSALALDVFVRGESEPLRPDLAWFAEFSSETGLLMVVVADRLRVADLWRWPCLRAGARMALRCPTWLMVVATRRLVGEAIEDLFVHQRELMPIVVTRDQLGLTSAADRSADSTQPSGADHARLA